MWKEEKLSEKEMLSKQDIQEAVKQGVYDAFIMHGFPVNERKEVQADMKHLRDMRKGCEAVKSNIVKAVITVTIPATLFILWHAIKQSVK